MSNDLATLDALVVNALKKKKNIKETRIIRNKKVMHVPAGTIVWRYLCHELSVPFAYESLGYE